MYTIRLLAKASDELRRLDKVVARRLVGRLQWLGLHLDEINPQALTGELAGFYKQREGDYRIVYEIDRDEAVILVHSIGHRREVYRRR